MNVDEEPTTFAAVRRKLVDAEVGQWAPDIELSKRRHSEYQRALDAITAAGVEHAERVGASLEWRANPSIYGILEEGINVLSHLRFAVRSGEFNQKDEEPLRLWSHRSQPLYDLKIKRTPSLGRQDIEAVVGSYLRLPYRAQVIDRMLVDLLIALELYGYGDEILNPVYIKGLTPTPPLKQSAVLGWLTEIGVGLAIWIVVALVLWGLAAIRIFPGSWLLGANALLALLFLANAAWATVFLPRAMLALRNRKQAILGLLTQMNSVYLELRSDGPISARHIEERARKAADAGVVWPAPLFALLDDISRRDGRF
jgi:hypothetical protein